MEAIYHKYTIESVGLPQNTSRIGVIRMSCNCNHGHVHHNHDYDVTQTMSQAAEYNFSIQKGATLDFDVIYKDATKRPVNLTGYTAKCVAQFNNKTFTINAIIEDPCNGCIKLCMSPYETSKIFTMDYKYANITDYTYQLNLISPANHVYRVMQGTICVSPAAGS